MSKPNGYYGSWKVSYLDAGNEIGTAQGAAIAIDGDDNSSNVGTQQGLWAAFQAALAGVTNGAKASASYYVDQVLSPALPTNGAARELKLLVMYRCLATGKRYSLTIPTLDPTIPVYVDNVSVKDAVRTDTPSQITALITAFENFVVAPDMPSDGDGDYGALSPDIEVIGLRVVGRNN